MENNAQNDAVTVNVNKDKIGVIIGAGGKTIREIQTQTGVNIEINDEGVVKISGASDEEMAKAMNWVKVLAGQLNRGDKFNGVIRRILDFGIFVELVPGVDGLVHISAIPREEQDNIQQAFPVGSNLSVEVMEYNPSNRRISLKIA